MAFKITTGTKNLQPVWTVEETKGKRVIETRQFFDQGEAHKYVQQALEADRMYFAAQQD